MDNFVYVLIAASVVLGTLLFVFSYVYIPTELREIAICNFTVGTVGFTTNHEARVDSMGSFTVGEPQTQNLKYIPQINLYSNYLSSGREKLTVDVPLYYLDTSQGVEITFTVYDTNLYGNLVVEWNGKRFYHGYAEKGPYKIFIPPEYVKSINTVEFYCNGPGWYFWASSAYVLRNMKIDLKYGPAKIIPFKIFPKEMESLTNIRLSFVSMGSGEGTLKVKVNGAEIYNDYASGLVNIDFDLYNTSLSIGNNILTFSSKDGVFSVNDVKLRIFITTNQVVRENMFNLTHEQYGILEQGNYRGRIDYKIDRIVREGNLKIEINGKHLAVTPETEGWNTVYFTKDQIVEGENLVKFYGTGEWDISEAKVLLEIIS